MVKVLGGLVYKYYNNDNRRGIRAFSVVQNYLYFLANNFQGGSWGEIQIPQLLWGMENFIYWCRLLLYGRIVFLINAWCSWSGQALCCNFVFTTNLLDSGGDEGLTRPYDTCTFYILFSTLFSMGLTLPVFLLWPKKGLPAATKRSILISPPLFLPNNYRLSPPLLLMYTCFWGF